MNKRKGLRLFTVLALCMVLVCSFSMTAFAYADDTDQNLPITEATQPEDMPDEEPEEKPTTELPEGEPIDDEGNAYTRDLLYDKATNKQFITVQTKSGNTFYIVIDYDAPINDEEEQYQTYFLNMVDEADLLALMDEAAVEALTTCVCEDKCVVGDIDVECPVCKTTMSECTGTVPEPETPVEGDENEQPDDTEEPEKSSNMGMIIGVIAVVGIGGAAYYSFCTSPLGVTLTAEDVTPNGLTLVCTQSGGAPTGELQTGSRFWLEVYSEGNWFPVKDDMEDVFWTMEAWSIPRNKRVEWSVSWETLYGSLPTGQYRIGKEIMDFRAGGDYDEYNYYAVFTVE